MTRFAFLLIIVGVITAPGSCQVHDNIQTDTLFCINLTDGQGVNYEIIQTIDLQNNHWVDSTRMLIIFYDTNKTLIHLPIPDEEVKNFSIEKITKNNNGITLITSQGGGMCIVRRQFVFIIHQQQLFLDKIISDYESFDSEEIEQDVRSFNPNLRIDEIKLSHFL